MWKCWKEQKRAEWIAGMVPKISEFLITSWKFWEKKIILKLRWIRPGKYCCLKLYCIFFELGEPHFASRERWRNKETTPEKIIGVIAACSAHYIFEFFHSVFAS